MAWTQQHLIVQLFWIDSFLAHNLIKVPHCFVALLNY
jgi:hypothetical protein